MLNELAKEAFEIAEKRGKFRNKTLYGYLKDIEGEVKEVWAESEQKKQARELIDVLVCTLSTLHFIKADLDKLTTENFEYNKSRDDYDALRYISLKDQRGEA